MDHKLICCGFTPPVPMRMSAYLDEQTKGLLVSLDNLSIYRLDQAIELINARPSLAEQAALLYALEERLIEFGRGRGYLAPPPHRTEQERSNIVLNFLVKDVLNISGGSVQEKVFQEVKGKLKTIVTNGLNGTTKSRLKFLDFILSLCNANSREEVYRILVKEGGVQFGENWKRITAYGLRGVRVSPVTKNRLIKFIAMRLTWGEAIVTRLSWLNPWILFVDLILTPETTASDVDEKRLTILMFLGRVFAARTNAFSKLVQSCSEREWRLTSPVGDALRAAVLRMS